MLRHVDEALQAELLVPHEPDGRAETATLAALTTLLAIGASQVAPVAGPVAVAAAAATFAPRLKRQLLKLGTPPQVDCAVETVMAGRVLPSKTTDDRVKAWQAWLPWESLCGGQEVPVPAQLPHPTCVGFEFTRTASRVGQAVDWVAPLADGSRLHVHEYPDGSRTVHRDQLDPARGPATATIHWLHETREGNALGLALTAGLVTLGWMLVE